MTRNQFWATVWLILAVSLTTSFLVWLGFKSSETTKHLNQGFRMLCVEAGGTPIQTDGSYTCINPTREVTHEPYREGDE